MSLPQHFEITDEASVSAPLCTLSAQESSWMADLVSPSPEAPL